MYILQIWKILFQLSGGTRTATISNPKSTREKIVKVNNSANSFTSLCLVRILVTICAVRGRSILKLADGLNDGSCLDLFQFRQSVWQDPSCLGWSLEGQAHSSTELCLHIEDCMVLGHKDLLHLKSSEFPLLAGDFRYAANG